MPQRLLETLGKYVPRHRLLLADFDELPGTRKCLCVRSVSWLCLCPLSRAQNFLESLVTCLR